MPEESPNIPEPVPPATPEQPSPPADQVPVPPAGPTPVPPSDVPQPVPPAGAQPVPPAGAQPVPPAGAQPVPPAGAQPVPPAGAQPVPPAQQPVPPAPLQPAAPSQPPQQPGFDTIQIQPGQGQPNINPPAPGPVPPVHQPQPQPPQPHGAMAAGAASAGQVPASRGGRRKPSKKVKRKSPSSKRPASARPGSYRRKPQPVDSGISVMTVFLFIVGLIMLSAAIFALLPANLSHIDGYPADKMTNKEPRNLLAVGQSLLEDRSQDATFTEKEVNAYINYRIRPKQKGAMGKMMAVQGVYVDLRDKEAEIFVERSLPILGRTTISTVVKSHFNDQLRRQTWRTGGGSIGRIPMKSKSLQPILEVFLRMKNVGTQEIQVMNYMADIKIEEDKLTLDASL